MGIEQRNIELIQKLMYKYCNVEGVNLIRFRKEKVIYYIDLSMLKESSLVIPVNEFLEDLLKNLENGKELSDYQFGIIQTLCLPPFKSKEEIYELLDESMRNSIMNLNDSSDYYDGISVALSWISHEFI